MRFRFRNQPLYTFCLATACFLSIGLCVGPVPSASAVNGEFEIRIVDDQSGDPVAAQVQIRDRRGRVRPIRRSTNWNRQYVVDGKAIVSLNPGPYTISVSRGPEYLDYEGHFLIESTATDNTTIRLKRFTNLSQTGWWSADLAVRHAERDMDAWLRSTDLHVASVQTYSFDGSWQPKSKSTIFAPTWKQNGDFWFAMSAGQDTRSTGSALVLNGAQAYRRKPDALHKNSSVDFLKLANQSTQSHICVARPNSWDLPIWLASGYVDSFMLLDPNLRFDAKKTKDPEGLPRDPVFYPEPHGWGQFSQDIYYHILNCGLKIPPVAGSGSGTTPNAVGYSRTYVYCGNDATQDSVVEETNLESEAHKLNVEQWWKHLRAGHVMVTNGPLLLPTVNGKPPGHVFQATHGETLRLTTQLTLHTREKIDYLEIVKNGRVLDDVMLADLVDKRGVLSDVEFTESGWFLIRAVTKSPIYHAVSTGPVYVDFDGKPRVSQKSVEFFRDWLRRHPASSVDTDRQQKGKNDLGKYHRAAAKFWKDLASRTTDD